MNIPLIFSGRTPVQFDIKLRAADFKFSDIPYNLAHNISLKPERQKPPVPLHPASRHIQKFVIFNEISISDMESFFVGKFFAEKEIKISLRDCLLKEISELLVIYMREVFKNFPFLLTEEQPDYVSETHFTSILSTSNQFHHLRNRGALFFK